VRSILLSFLMCAACSTIPIPKDPQECCKKLKKRDVTLKTFERLCIAMVFLEGRFKDDARAVKNIRDVLEACKYVHGVKE